MIILIGGVSHTGKTRLAQTLLEKNHYPYLSIDHLKMGLIRSHQTNIKVDDDKSLLEYLWPIVVEIIKTNIENRQNIIIEGIYIPTNFKDYFSFEQLKFIKYYGLAFNPEYLNNNIDTIINNQNIIEQRKDSDINLDDIKISNQDYLKHAKELNVIEINNDYKVDIDLNIVIKTDRLILRQITPNDFEQIKLILNDQSVTQVWTHHFDDNQVSNWINKRLEEYQKYGYGYWLVVLKATNEIIGQVGLVNENINDHDYIGLGYMLKSEYQKQGYCIEACQACLDYAFNHLRIAKVYASIRENNEQSKAVINKLGFSYQTKKTINYNNIEMPHLVYVRDNIPKQVIVTMDRMLGNCHPKYKDFIYPVNYGYVEGIYAYDNDYQDAYVLGENQPLSHYQGRVIAIIRRTNDCEDKWVVSNQPFTIEEITSQVNFQEQYFESTIQLLN